MAFPYNQVLLVGATAGIGAAMADKLIDSGVKVIAVGRRQDRLDEFVKKHGGSEHAAGERFDVTDHAGLDAFIDRIAKKYADLDCIFLNSGMQSAMRLDRPSEVDLKAFHREIDVNFTGVVNLALKSLELLQKRQGRSGLIYTGTHLALVSAASLPAYCASKAATGAFFECLAFQNKDGNVDFVHISPPVVQTELHDYAGPRGRSMGMPVNDFVDEVYKQLVAGNKDISIGQLGGVDAGTWSNFVETRVKMRDTVSEMTMKGMGPRS